MDKFHLGKKILDECLETFILIFKISKLNRQDNRQKKLLIEVNLNLDIERFLIRNCFEMKIIKLKQYQTISLQLLEIGKITGGLIKSLSTNKNR